MRHTALGYWLEEAGERPPYPAADGELACDVLGHHISGDPHGLPSTGIQPFFT